LTNCTVGAEENVRLFVKSPLGKKAIFMGQYAEMRKLEIELADQGFIVTLPRIEPWSVATVFFE
jgi:hypothetical protein